MKKWFFALFAISSLHACTDFLVEGVGGVLMNGRSMEFAMPLDSEVMLYPSKMRSQSKIFGGDEGFSWISKYAFVGMTSMGLDKACDGLNEKGLSFGVLWFPGTEYPKINRNNMKNIIALEDVGNWILGSFATVEEVKVGLQNIQIWAHEMSQLGTVPPLHFALHDASGKSMVVEFIEGKMTFFDNPVGVLTNAPRFDWQLTNLSNYVNLSPGDASSITMGKLTLEGPGHGTGMLGVPGDWTPPSRFVRIAYFKQFSVKEKVETLAWHLLNTVDIPLGTMDEGGQYPHGYTQWAIVKDLKGKKLYYRTYENLQIKMVDLGAFVLKGATEPVKVKM